MPPAGGAPGAFFLLRHRGHPISGGQFKQKIDVVVVVVVVVRAPA
jgi:hypothetical protein